MNKKLIKYFNEGEYWICYSKKLKLVGYGKSKDEAHKLFLFVWEYLKTGYKRKNKC
jgi:hypothetical protein